MPDKASISDLSTSACSSIMFPLGDHKRYWISEYCKQTHTDVPELEEQEAIAQVLEDCSNEIQLLKMRLTKVKAIQRGMMQELLIGRTRLPIEEPVRGMNFVGQLERMTHERVVKLFRDQLDYDYLGNWEQRTDTSNVEVQALEQNLEKRGYGAIQIGKAVERLRGDTSLGGGRDLYEANQDVYRLLRYGVHAQARDR